MARPDRGPLTVAMSLYPEQVQALGYARRQGTEAPLASLRTKVARTFGELEALVRTMPERLTAVPPAASRWSVHEIVDHLVVSHRRAVDELGSLVAGNAPSSAPIPAGLLSEDPFARPWPALLAELESVHRDLLGVLASATDETSLEARAPVVMVVKCAVDGGRPEPVEWVESFDWKAYAILVRAHTLEHLRQVERTLAAVGDPAGT